MVRSILRSLGRLPGLAAILALVSLALAGCGGNGGGANSSGGSSTNSARTGQGASAPALADTLRIGDMVEVRFSGSSQAPEDLAERIKDDGNITLPLAGPLRADGLSAGDLQKKIHDAYVPKFYRRLTVTVKTENRVFYVEGEVHRPDRYIYTGEITVMRAIATAGGFSDFAARRRLELVRSTGEKLIVDAVRARDHADADVIIYPGDRISVPRRSAFGR